MPMPLFQRAARPVPCAKRGVMSRSIADLDVIEELRLRRWAREHYVPAAERDGAWNAVVLDEMQQKDAEAALAPDQHVGASAYVPLHPGTFLTLHGPHAETEKAERLFKVPDLAVPRSP